MKTIGGFSLSACLEQLHGRHGTEVDILSACLTEGSHLWV